MTAPADAEARFNACLAETLKWEGGFSNDIRYNPQLLAAISQSLFQIFNSDQITFANCMSK